MSQSCNLARVSRRGLGSLPVGLRPTARQVQRVPWRSRRLRQPHQSPGALGARFSSEIFLLTASEDFVAKSFSSLEAKISVPFFSCHLERGFWIRRWGHGKGHELVTICEDVLHPPRTWPLQRARTYQNRVATAHAGHPSDILIVHSFWHQIASDDWTKVILPSDIMTIL